MAYEDEEDLNYDDYEYDDDNNDDDFYEMD
ncbi:hypothetical protein [Campylobacter jejuni]|nr:hypothetical protein [Campylobacter jejuni]